MGDISSNTSPGAAAAAGPSSAVVEATALCERLEQAGVVARLLGGLAVAARCPSAWPPSPLARAYSDVDVVVARKGARKLHDALTAMGLRAAERFNAANGHVRQLFTLPDGRDMDVFVSEFKMCHTLDLEARLTAEPGAVTLPLADLVLTKLQVAALTRKDVQDVAAILLDHALTEDDAGVNVARVAALTAGDWGWWKTVTDNLAAIERHAGELGLDAARQERVTVAAAAIAERIERQSKSLRWKARARVGERVAWREDPEEK